ncbi:SigE family RNA polymerase sigma factor [Actinacidiphila acidipaludis]|uniref:SigE family RNA polymerase sigma factor n=1 Tax=Actinacidiphila acidipaludis TaxID=2873382 RepID=A0ABS7QF27_9ACTN|nr:SigE family RNA polymerase sigma factor [Streptomyces acidipaludis]MBY8881768.1 SigE family RNA polymerase sigma factor [Streptomyces acidipaludis]
MPVRAGDHPGPQAPPADGTPDFSAYAAVRWSRLVCTAYLLTGDHHEAEDLVQATLAKVYLHWPRISRLGEPDAYLRRALVNNNLSRFRKRRVVQLLTPRLPDRERDSGTGQVEDRTSLTAALAALPARQRAVVVLRYWEDMSEQQVADVLGCTVGNVKSQASRGLRKLRTHPALAGLGVPGDTPDAGSDSPGAGDQAGTAPGGKETAR